MKYIGIDETVCYNHVKVMCFLGNKRQEAAYKSRGKGPAGKKKSL